MSEKNFLTISFLDTQPRSAARVLEEIEPGDAAAFLNRVPAHTAALVVCEMIPWAAARCMECMKHEHAGSVTRELPYSDALSILRLANEDARDKILALTTKRFARNFKNSLVYPRDTVGAWMDIGAPSLQEEMLIKDAMRTAKRMNRDHTQIFLINPSRALVGAISAADLFRHDETARLGDIADRTITPLSSRDSLRACQHRAEWDRFTLLPVIGRKKNFLGGFSRANLRRALLSQDSAAQAATPGSLVVQVMSAFLDVSVAFANLTLQPDRDVSLTRTKENSRGRKRARSD